jgi:poly-gamma-glutamate capsule biosynthesis protein CapA/YwtB (metallophosphatase superfamily)
MSNEHHTVMAFTGNLAPQQRFSPCRDEKFLKVVELLRSADVSFTNLECCIQDGEDFPAYVAGNGRGATYLAGPPHTVEEVKWMGIKMVYAANNHAADFAEGGILTTIKYFKAGGLAYAGIGASLTAATAPGYLETPTGTVALIAAADWGPRGRMDLPYQMPAAVMAADEGPLFKSRPGLNLIRYDAVTQVDRATFDAIRRASKELGWEQAKAGRRRGGGRDEALIGPSLLGGEQDSDTEFHFMGRKFALADKFDFTTAPYQEDLERNYRWVREARKQAEFVVVAFHDQGARRPDEEEYTRIFAYGAIDAGADIYVNTGCRHGGIEIYKGKVILHGLPAFFIQNEQVRQVPNQMLSRWGLRPDESTPADFLDARDRGESHGKNVMTSFRNTDFRGSAIHTVTYDEKRNLKEIRIYPLTKISTGPRSELGRPRWEPDTEEAQQVLQRSVERSNKFGTRVEIENGVVGVVRVK